MAFSLGSPSTCAGVPGPWLTCSLQATESVLSPQKRLTAKFTKSTATCAPSGLSLTGDYNRVVSVTPSLPPLPSSLHPLQNTHVSFLWTSPPLNDGLKAPFGRASWPASSHALMFTGSDHEGTMRFAVTRWLLSNGARFLSANLLAPAPEGKDRPRLFSNDAGDYRPYLFNGQL